MGIDFDILSLTGFIELRDEVERQLRERFEREVALVFTDVVGSTAYAERWGDVAARSLLDRHLRLVRTAVQGGQGRLVDVAGDGAFCVFPSLGQARGALVWLMEEIEEENRSRQAAEALQLRAGLHFGSVLIDAERVSGDAVNFAARVMGSGGHGEIRVSNAVYANLEPAWRLRCAPLGTADFKGISGSTEVWLLDWRETPSVPSMVHVEETGERVALPEQQRISFGRLARHHGRPANDIVLALPDRERTRCISRWHFELLRSADELVLHQLSGGLTVVDGMLVGKGERAPIRVGSEVVVSKVATLHFLGSTDGTESSLETHMAGADF